jgi:outer membrane receptor protein involved in Fe transport
LDKLVVTGEKIDKKFKDTTTAVTVISGDELESGETKQVRELATQAPNVITDSFGNISIRGISGGGAATGGAALITGSRARVTTVVDGTTQDWSGYNFTPVGLWDVKQVEILRGPQSTTQGASAIGGALVINTNDPTFDYESAVRAGLDSYKNGHIRYNAAVMFSGPLIEDELAYRLAVDETKGDGWLNYNTSTYDVPNLSESESLNARGKLLWKPTNIPKFTAKLTLNHHKNEGEHASFASNTEADIATQTLDISSAVARVQNSKENSIATDIDYQLDPGVTNALHLSYTDSDIHADGYQTSNVFTYDIDQTTKSLENRLVFNREHADLTGLFGIFASDKDSSIDAFQGVSINTQYTTKTTAAYGESTYALSSRTKATAGLRIEHEDINKTGSLITTTEHEQDSDDTYYLPKIGMTHAISNSTTLGATVRKGYSPGGSGVTVTGGVFTYSSEKVTSYELSSKSNFDGETTLNANLFYNDYSDYQALSGLTITNVDKAHTYGLELEVKTWTIKDLELWGSVGLLQSEIDEYTADTDTVGKDLSSAPNTNLSIGFTKYIGDSWSLGADATYVGKFYSDLDNSRDSEVGDVTITNLRAQYMIGDLTIDAYVKNLTDEDAVYYRSGALATVGQTRTFGLSATYHM